MIIPAQTLRQLKPIEPFVERSAANGMTYGLGPAGYDVRVAERVVLWPVNLENLVNNWLAKWWPYWLPGTFRHRPSFCLASTGERFDIPADLTFKVEDKSTWARLGLSVFNSTAEPGWRGWLTLELKNQGEEVIHIPVGAPIAQLCFHRLEEPTEEKYEGKYQDQQAGPQPARRLWEA